MTYRGPDDWFRIDDPDTITFYRGVPEEVSVEVATALVNQEGHEFSEGDEPDPIGPRATEAAAKLAEEKDVDLASIDKPSGVNGDITLDDVKAAIDAAEANDQPVSGSTE